MTQDHNTYQVCIDIGGTFTDCLVADAAGEIKMFKSPTTPGAFERGFINVLHLAAADYGLAPADFLSRVGMIVHGTTVSTNALVERKVGQAGMIVNQGHRDALMLREGPRKGAFQWKLDYPDPFVPRNLTREVAGRMDARGRELVALDEDAVVRAAADLRRAGANSVAVGLLWSVANGDHECRVREIVEREWPGVPVTLSHEVNPVPREYRRFIAAAIDASLYPVVSAYVSELTQALEREGYRGELLIANCVGGMMPAEEVIRRPIYSVMSGPTLAPIAAKALTVEQDVIVGDMGGTTFDVSALRDRQLIITPEAVINEDLLGIPKVDVRSIGAGGGSIAWVDEGGLLQVGPQSAGARPGPACYGQGGTEPTVTDANVLLGIIDPDFFLGGGIALDRGLAEAAVGRIAESLGVGLIEAAYAIYTTSNHNMVTAIEDITVREGIDPRESYFVSGGGGTACHIAEMAEVLGLKRYMIPKYAAGLSAFGGLISDLRWEASRTFHTSDQRFDFAAVERILEALRTEGEAFLTTAGIAAAERSFEYSFKGRYEYQSWDIDVTFSPEEGLSTQEDVARLAADFHQMHERIYSIKEEDDTVEMTTWTVRAIGHRPVADLWRRSRLPAQSGAVEAKSRRPVYLGPDRGLVETPVYDGHALGSGASIAGPCVIEETAFSALLLAGHDAVGRRSRQLSRHHYRLDPKSRKNGARHERCHRQANGRNRAGGFSQRPLSDRHPEEPLRGGGARDDQRGDEVEPLGRDQERPRPELRHPDLRPQAGLHRGGPADPCHRHGGHDAPDHRAVRRRDRGRYLPEQLSLHRRHAPCRHDPLHAGLLRRRAAVLGGGAVPSRRYRRARSLDLPATRGDALS